ncbi:MAG TPA: alpha/beta hydrolase [Acidimicrobiales bacterium]|nr:alpha/beta hydrolase [Acidimicrobiales bacterium]
MRVPSTDGVELTVHDLGGDGPPLLLCHATGFHGKVWTPMAEYLSSRFRLWSLDFRGHGMSTSPVGRGFAWEGFGDDVLAVVDALGLDHLAGIGHSKGGTALLLAEQARPGTFTSLVLYEPIVFPPDLGPPGGRGDDNPLAAGAERRREVFPSKEAAYQHYAAKPPLSVLAREALRAYVDHGFEPLGDGTVRLRCRGADEAQVYRMGGSHGAWDGLPGVSCPTTVATGGTGGTISPEVGARLAARLGAARLEVFDELGHFGPLEDPGRVARSVVAALTVAP